MNRLFISSLLLSFVAIIGVSCCENQSSRPLVILSTNDMHAKIDNFAALATAIAECRDTADVILVDAGDRWTGNAFVDLVEHYTPIYELMNHLDYDLAIYGNHEFDKGQAYLAESNRQADFEILGANIKSDTNTFPQPPSHTIIEKDGLKIGFVGVVSTYDTNGHPAGKDSSYEGLSFTDPQECAGEFSYLKDSCDVLVLVTHIGLSRDREFANSEYSKDYDMVIGGHSHDITDEVVNGIQLGQTGNKLKNLGATTITKDSDGKINITYRNVPLSDYAKDAKVAEMVTGYLGNPELNKSIGTAVEDFNQTALDNFFPQQIKEKAGTEIGIYHSGGVRLSEIPRGDISTATILNLEPFSATICTIEMTTDEMRKMIMTKFNDTKNLNESHSIDLIATVPYTVVTDKASGDATDVIFPTLKKGKKYSIAIGDYVIATYGGLEYSNLSETGVLITATMIDYITENQSISPDNKVYQTIKGSSKNSLK